MTDQTPGLCPFPDCKGFGITRMIGIAEGSFHRTTCSNLLCCATGPLCHTASEAIAAWNAPGEKVARLKALIKVPDELAECFAQHDELKDVISCHDDTAQLASKTWHIMIHKSVEFVRNLIAQQEGGE